MMPLICLQLLLNQNQIPINTDRWTFICLQNAKKLK